MQRSFLTRHLAVFFTVAAACLRLLTNSFRIYNIASVGAVGLYGGARLRTWQAFALPLALMIGTDVLLTLLKQDPQYSLTDPSRPWVYGSYVLYVVIGRYIIGRRKSPLVIGGATLLASTQFFLITNFQAWLAYDFLYARNVFGLLDCYVKALPFAGNTFASDLIFTGMLFALHAWCAGPATEQQPEPGVVTP